MSKGSYECLHHAEAQGSAMFAQLTIAYVDVVTNSMHYTIVKVV